MGKRRLTLCLMFLLAAVGLPQAAERFRSEGPVLEGAADWVSVDRNRVVFGSKRRVSIAPTRPGLALASRLLLDRPAVDGVIAGDNLFVIERLEGPDRLRVLRIDSPTSEASTPRLDPAPRGRLHLALMDDYLLLVEDGYGLRILRISGHRHAGHDHHPPEEALTQVGFFPIGDEVSAVASSVRTIYIATANRLLVLDAKIPALPGFVRAVPLDHEVRSLDANGATVFLLGGDGLRTLDLSTADPAPPSTDHPEVQGQFLLVSGRSVLVASGDGGLQTYRDLSSIAETFFVQVGDVFFSPAGVLNVNVGDTVQWQKPATAFTHNVFSCTAAQSGCGGVAATESFVSGPVTTSPFIFAHTFNEPGSNPYICQSHFLTMVGDINVSSGPGPPPGVPDGTAGSAPMLVSKLDGAGVDLSIRYDTGCPDAAGHDIIFGNQAGLPGSPGGIYGLTGGRCGIGTTSPFTWTASPATSPGQLLWWVIVADDGSFTEGSWGKDGRSAERDGAGLNGASGQCGNTDKNLENVCGQ
jgi:plastocyanin